MSFFVPCFFFGTFSLSYFFEFALRFDELDGLSFCLVVFLFALVILSISHSNTNAPVRGDLGINHFTIKGKLDKTSLATTPKFDRSSEPPKYNSDLIITNKINL
jgi:hypothetical protein